LIANWKENYHDLDTIFRDEAWAKIASAVEAVAIGDKTVKQCKKMIENLKNGTKKRKD